MTISSLFDLGREVSALDAGDDAASASGNSAAHEEHHIRRVSLPDNLRRLAARFCLDVDRSIA
jgi:hypothetical protein